MNKTNEGGNGGTSKDPFQSRPLYHDDENLQDEQELFDQENAGSKLNIALLSRLMQVRENEREEKEGKKPKTYKLTIGDGYPSPKNNTNARKIWDSDFLGKTITTKSSSHFLDLCDAESSCLIRLVSIDAHLESGCAEDEIKLKDLEDKARDEMLKLRNLINKTQAQTG